MSTMSINHLRQFMKAIMDLPSFERVTNKMNLISASPGKVVCDMKIEDEHTNANGTLHGGMTATLVDTISSAALLYTERGQLAVSVDMNITYMDTAKLGDSILITAQVLKQGQSLAFVTVDLINKDTKKIIAQGRHTMHLGI
ncbi:acyl-coenzyme A thioesterase 13-like [Microcaecilia unicolor]|uniref:Acyl-coenzyme A thioesterase 13 n=1 Tax=Microcaecilia unicolor TaxID=1415580 RepID=A0A6P7YVJ8_9AMPH|nr:acyl-coenzyme A thioesterase 13-like [Microcaecilia unicolor]